MKILNKQEFHQILIDYSPDVDFMKLYKNSTVKSFFFLVNDTTLASDNPLRVRCNLLNIKRDNGN